MTTATGTKRRTLLQRGAALLAGGVALAGTSRWAGDHPTMQSPHRGGPGAASPPVAAPPKTLTLYARLRPAAAPDAHGRIVASADLFDRPDGERIGTFYSNAFCAVSPFGGAQAAASNLAFQVLELRDGTLFGIGAGDQPGAIASAIVGGTNGFAGRSGSCVQRSLATTIGDDVRELTITFA